MKKMHFLAILAVLFLLPACLAFGGAPATQTQPAPVTVEAPTLPPLSSPTAPPAATAPPATTATSTQPLETVTEAIAILQPGPGSRVVSPLRVSGMANPTFEQSLVVTILLADGETISTGSTQIGADIGQRGPYSLDLPFTVEQEQQGFVQVFATSAKDGGVTHLASVGVSLAPDGAANILLAAEQPEQIVINQPRNGDTISGGLVRVEGFGLASFEQTLVIDVLDEEGQPLATIPVMVAAPDLGQPGPFSAELRYSIAAETSARVQVRDVSPAHGGNSHLTSVEVRLEP
jgi:hypothetical protein